MMGKLNTRGCLRHYLRLEIMHHCVALPWNTKTGSPPAAGRNTRDFGR
jgi:hypothetical protein